MEEKRKREREVMANFGQATHVYLRMPSLGMRRSRSEEKGNEEARSNKSNFDTLLKKPK